MTIRALYPNLTPSLLLDFAKGKVVDPRVSFSRAGGATYLDAYGNWQEVPENMPRFDHDPTTGVCRGLLIEPQATNRNTNPRCEGFSVGVIGSGGALPTGWGGPSSTVTREILGTTVINGVTCLLIRFTGVPGTTGPIEWRVGSGGETTTVGTRVINSVFVALVAGTLTNVGGFSLRTEGSAQTGFTPSATLQRIVNNRVITGTTSATIIRYNYTDTVTAVDYTLAVGWPQRQHEDILSTPILPPVGTLAQSTRGSDSLETTNLSGWFNNASGSLVIQATRTQSTTLPLVSFDDNTVNEQINLYTNVADPKFTVSDGGVTQADLNGGTTVTNTSFKLAAAYAQNDFALCLNGTTTQTDASGTVPTVDRMRIGSDVSANQFVGYMNRIAYYPERLINSELENLTK